MTQGAHSDDYQALGPAGMDIHDRLVELEQQQTDDTEIRIAAELLMRELEDKYYPSVDTSGAVIDAAKRLRTALNRKYEVNINATETGDN